MWIELTERRGQKEKHFYDSDTNKFRAVLTIHDQHFKDDFDDWIDVDENFVDDTGSFNKKCDKTRHAVHVGNGGNRRWYPRRNVQTEYVDILGIQYWTGSQWRNINLPTPVWRNNISEWDMTHLYASLTNTWRRIKADFILKDNLAPTGLRYQVSFTGLTYNSTTGELTSTTDGMVWGSIDKPNAHYGTFPNEVNVPVTQSYDGTYIEWSVDTAGALFPIYIDPTLTDGYGSTPNTEYDTSLDGTYWATTNFGTDALLYVGYFTTEFRGHGLLKFDVSSIAASSTCDSATLYLYTAEAQDNQDYTRNQVVYRMARAWTEAGATWNTYDGSNNWGTAGASNTSTDREASTIASTSVTANRAIGVETQFSLSASAVQDWWDGDYTNNGIQVRDSADDTDNCFSTYGSSDNGTTGYRPKLVVEYTEGGGCVNVVVQTTVVVDWCEP